MQGSRKEGGSPGVGSGSKCQAGAKGCYWGHDKGMMY
jgi:hypothetical protein